MVSAVRVDWRMGADGVLVLRWVVAGAGALVVPVRAAVPARTDGLWQATCCELFLRGEGDAYREINLSPSGHWAAYAFDAYRGGMRDAPFAAPGIEVQQGFTLTATLPGDVLHGATRASLTAVIEETGGHKSCWALAHGGGAPDFHAPSCFVLPIGAAHLV
jgi:hypothetical protein